MLDLECYLTTYEFGSDSKILRTSIIKRAKADLIVQFTMRQTL